MINFAKFINEAEERGAMNPKSLSDDFMRMFGKLIQKAYVFVDTEEFTNEYGNMVGYLYINKLSAIRVNFKNGVIHSFSKWERYNGSTPDLMVILKNKTKLNKKGLVDMYPEISDALCYKNINTGTDINNYGIITLATGEKCYSVEEVVCTLFKQGYNFEMIEAFLEDYDMTRKDVMHILRRSGYNPSKVGTKTMEDYEGIEAEEVSTSEEADADIDASNAEVEAELEELNANSNDIQVIPAVKEEVKPTESMIKNQAALADQLIADPLPVFRQLNTYVLMVARGFNNALLITGQGGVGKSYNVNRILSAYGTKGKDYVIMKGKSTVSAMYQFLYDNYNKIVVFDDCDSIIQNSDGMNILKGVLDSGRIREVSWNTRGVVDTFGCETHAEVEAKLKDWSKENNGKKGCPSYFRFEGAIIFISNLPKSAFEDALLTRVTAVDINLMAEEVILRMESVLPSIKIYNTRGQDITDNEIKQEVFDYISSKEFLEDPRIKGKQISFRLFNKAYMFRYAGLPDWKELSFCI